MQTGFLLSLLILAFLIVASIIISLIIKNQFSQKPNTPKEILNQILHEMKMTKSDKFIDLGAGDYRVVFGARRKIGVDAVGVEISPLYVLIAKIRRLAMFGLNKYPEVRIENLFKTDLSKFTHIYANIDNCLEGGLIENIKRTAKEEAVLFTLNDQLGEIIPDKKIKIDEHNSLLKYSVKRIKDLN